MSPDDFPGDPDPGDEPAFELPELHRATRMPLDAVVRLHFEGTVAYQNGFAANVSAKGMFVKHPDPPPVGTRLVFEFVLGEQRKPVQGAGVVSWIREKYEGPGKTAGVGIEFTEMDGLSRQHIAEAIFEYLESQLGIELADHPEVQRLVDSLPSSTPVPIEPIGTPTPAPAAKRAAGPLFEATEQATSGAAPPAPSLPFRVFDDGVESPVPESSPELFRPEVPPEDLDFLEGRGGAVRRRTNPWVSAAIFFVILAGGFAGWWFLAGPGSVSPPPPKATAAKPAAPTAARQPLSATPGNDATLAESVGAKAAAGTSDETATEAETPTEATPPPLPADDEAAAKAAMQHLNEIEKPAPPASPAAAPATHLQQITWTSSPGVTEVNLTGDGGFAEGTYHWYEMDGASPRVLVKLVGMAAAFKPETLSASTPELAGVRTGFHPQASGNEIHVVLDLAGARVRVSRVTPIGNKLVVRLETR